MVKDTDTVSEDPKGKEGKLRVRWPLATIGEPELFDLHFDAFGDERHEIGGLAQFHGALTAQRRVQLTARGPFLQHSPGSVHVDQAKGSPANALRAGVGQ